MSGEVTRHCPRCSAKTQFSALGGYLICQNCGVCAKDSKGGSIIQACPCCSRVTLELLTQDWWGCRPCGWQGNTAKLTAALKRGEDGDKEILDCMREDQRRGTPGGSSKSGKGSDDKLRAFKPSRSLDDALEWSRVQQIVKRDEFLRLRIVAPAELIQEALAKMAIDELMGQDS